MLNGFNVNESLPTGVVKVGEWLGSERPFPTGLDLAISPGNTDIPILTLPAYLPSLS